MLEVLPKGIDFKGGKIVTGFHGIGATGYWTVRYLIQKLEAERVAFLDSDYVAPVAATSSGRLITPHEVYKKDDLYLLKIDVPVYRENEVPFYRELASWISEAGFEEAALVGGLDANLRVDDSSHRIVTTRGFVPRPPLTDSKVLEDDHIIVGPVAALLNRFEVLNFPAFAILSYASTERVDPRAACAAIDVISSIYNLNIDTAPLIKGAEALEQQTYRRDRTQEPEHDAGSMYT